MAWSTARKVAFVLTIFNFFINPLLIYFSTWGASLRVFGCLCSMIPHALGFFGCLFKVPCLLITYIVLTTVGFLVEIWLGVSNLISLHLIAYNITAEEGIKREHEFTMMKWNKTRPDEYYKSYGLKCLIGGGLGIVYCVFQVVLLCFSFNVRKEIRTEQQREMYNAMGYPPVRQENTRPEPVPSSSARPSKASETE
ncbi:hypothetical protein PRIPAC_84401 [Pristionchus pacificus]|uniref:Uncharacterized protein n=1 Tax=Pristionchus pacificus TaxID=54126 RepID=A0A2A6BTH7_PRIPA|nr:hypothetical protein PRIPAC_84401 [Pristionchus pacificus]|eukprot:PDM69188.1 hypothetical protein PRIPAC_47490 [Pristionchus pacificus]